MEAASRISGLSEETLRTVAHMIVEATSVSILWAMGVTQHSQGSDTSTAISNLLLITGNYMRPGTGAYPMRGHNNVQGASDHGSMPNSLPGYQSVDDPEVRARFEKAWNVPLPSTTGLDNHQMVEAIHAVKLNAMYVIGEEMSIVDSNANYVSAAFEKLDFFVVQDIFFPQFCDWGRPGRSTVYQTEYWAGVSCKWGADAGNSDWPRSLASSSRCWLRVAVGRGRGRIDMGAPVHPPDLGSGEL